MRRVKSAPENLCNMKNNRKNKSSKSIPLIFPLNNNNYLGLNEKTNKLETNNIFNTNILPFQRSYENCYDNKKKKNNMDNNLLFRIKTNIFDKISKFEDQENYTYSNNNYLDKNMITLDGANNKKKNTLSSILEVLNIKKKFGLSEASIKDTSKKKNNLSTLMTNTLMDYISDERVMPMEEYSVLNLLITYISTKANANNLAELKLVLINTFSKYLASYIIHKYIITQLPVIIHSLPVYISQ